MDLELGVDLARSALLMPRLMSTSKRQRAANQSELSVVPEGSPIGHALVAGRPETTGHAADGARGTVDERAVLAEPRHNDGMEQHPRRWPLFVLPLAAAVPGLVGLPTWTERVGFAAFGYVFMLTELVLIVVVRTYRNGVPLRRLVSRRPRRTLEIPDAVSQELPELMWVLCKRHRARLTAMVLGGSLLTPGNVRYTVLLAPNLSAKMVHRAIGDGDRPPERKQLTALVDEALVIARSMPLVPPDRGVFERWLVQLSGGEVSYRVARPYELNLTHLCVVMALGAAAAIRAGQDHDSIYTAYSTLAENASHGFTFPPSWQRE